jgi:hypothetical protein
MAAPQPAQRLSDEAGWCITAKSGPRGPLRVIRDRVEPAESPAMSAMPPTNSRPRSSTIDRLRRPVAMRGGGREKLDINPRYSSGSYDLHRKSRPWASIFFCHSAEHRPAV